MGKMIESNSSVLYCTDSNRSEIPYVFKLAEMFENKETGSIELLVISSLCGTLLYC